MTAVVMRTLILLLATCSFSANAAMLLQRRGGNLYQNGEFVGTEKGLFHTLMEEWKKIPDKTKFVADCEGIVGKLMPRLQKEYTARQVPKIVMHECDNYATGNDFKTINTTLDEGKRACKNCAARLGAEFLGNQNYKSWCEYVHDLMSREGLADHYHNLHQDYLKDIEDLKAQLRELQRQYEAALEGRGGGKGAGHAKTEAEKKRDSDFDKLKKHWDDQDLPCCPKGCQPCDEDGKPVELPKELRHLLKKAKFLQKKIKRLAVTGEILEKGGKVEASGLFHQLLKEWKEIPDKKTFVADCSDIVGKLMPKLRQEYTSRQVPKIVFHECSNYATKNDFKTVNTTLEEGQHTCEKCATRLGAEFLGNQNYGAWCDYVFDMLKHDMLKDHYRDLHRGYLEDMAGLKNELADLKAKLEALKHKSLEEARLEKMRDYWDTLKDMPCCPKQCKPCFDEFGDPIFGPSMQEEEKKDEKKK